MKYECNLCGERCKTESDFKPTVCLKHWLANFSWEMVSAPAPKPLSEAVKLPKLTVEVFDRADCPEWVKYAAVNMDRTAFFFGNVPNRGCSNPRKKYWSYHHSEMMQIPGQFDPSDWQNSLIKRPEKKKLPDWCKVGVWVWDTAFEEYLKIISIQNNDITAANNKTQRSDRIDIFQPARVRPWTFEEAPLAFKTKDDVLTLYFSISDTWEYKAAKRIPGAYSLEEVTELIQADGSPCGVLEVAEVAE